MKIQIHPEAEMDLFDAAAWYEEQLPGLGDDLLAEMDRWLVVIAEAPLVWPSWPDAPVQEPMIRRALTDRFPFAIAFQAHADRVAILAFAHTSRRPLYWEDRKRR